MEFINLDKIRTELAAIQNIRCPLGYSEIIADRRTCEEMEQIKNRAFALQSDLAVAQWKITKENIQLSPEVAKELAETKEKADAIYTQWSDIYGAKRTDYLNFVLNDY